MTGSGMFYTDAALVCFMVYVFWGGWAVTLAGGVMSIQLARRPGRRALGVALLFGCLAPLAYELFWYALSQSALPEPDTSGPLTIAVTAGLAICVFAGPLAAWFCLRAPRAPIAPS
ncbi:hypothetical protein [Caulobacter sp.]|uniref:hypothetical protein n=1 Tax=Caulobacter sp. TaxID=78 RepID=UPI003BB0BFE0